MPELERQFHSAGYFLIEPAPRPAHSNNALLPEFVVSISPHICDLHPPTSLLSWVNDHHSFVDGYKKKLDLGDENFVKTIRQTDELFEGMHFGWNSVFYKKEKAVEFFQDHLYKIFNIKLFQVLIPAEFSSHLINAMHDETSTPHGVETSMRKSGLVSMKDSDFIGYEVICYDVCEFHSFLCNSLEQAFLQKLDIHLNQRGLIASLEDAIRASDFCNSEESGAEPGYWLPCGLLEIPLSKTEVDADA